MWDGTGRAPKTHVQWSRDARPGLPSNPWPMDEQGLLKVTSRLMGYGLAGTAGWVVGDPWGLDGQGLLRDWEGEGRILRVVW